MFFLLSKIVLILLFNYSHEIKHLNEITIEEELPIGSIITSLTDKIPNLDQSIEYDLVTPSSNDFDLFSIDHKQHVLLIKDRIDYEKLCLKQNHCVISVSIAVANEDRIDVYIQPVRIINTNDNLLKFPVNRTVIEIEENDENWVEKSYKLPRAYDDDGTVIIYEIYLSNWSKPYGLFEFDEKNFLLKPLKKFDREEQNIYLLRFVARNENDISTDIIIIIKDTNDNRPICQQNRMLFLITDITSVTTFHVNVTDFDEGDNGKLEYKIINPVSGFNIDRFNGQIKFDYRKWIDSNQSTLIINVTDHGKDIRLSTECFVDVKFTFLFDIDFQGKHLFKNQTNIYMNIEHVYNSTGKFIIYEKYNYNKTCLDCSIDIRTSFKDIFYLNASTLDLYLNVNSLILMKILTNYNNKHENLTVNIEISIKSRKHPSMTSTKTFLFILSFNKLNILMNSNTYFMKIYENILLNEHISIYNPFYYCLNNPSNEYVLIDPTNTFQLGQNYNLVLKKYLKVQQQNIYQIVLVQRSTNNNTKSIGLCSVEFYIYVLDPYSNDIVFPHFSQSFYIFSSQNISQLKIPLLSASVKYVSSVPELITLNPHNGSIVIRSSTLFSRYFHDFQIKAIDFQTPSLSCFVPVRIYFKKNQNPPILLTNSTEQIIKVSSSKFLSQVQADDPEVSSIDLMNSRPPVLEYEISSPTESLEIERFTGRIFLKDTNTNKINFTLIIKDFGQPTRLTTEKIFLFHIKSNENISISFFLITLAILLVIIILSILLITINFCSKPHDKSLDKCDWKNISPATQDTRLIDNEYMVTASLPHVPNGEQKIYSKLSYLHLTHDYQHVRKHFSHMSLDKLSIDQPCLSTADINKYLERFEKIYNDSSSQQYLNQPMGSVV